MNPKIIINDRVIAETEPVFIIAEAGVNHNGSLNLAKKLIDVAKEAGADAVKFQTFKAENIATKNAPKAQYQIDTTGNKQSWFELLKSEELSLEHHYRLIEYCKKNDIIFLSTPYDMESADLLDRLNLQAFKVASTDMNNIPFLKYLAKKGKPIILSTAMSTLDEIAKSISAIKDEGLEDLIVLHCTANYPAPLSDSNLKAMLIIRNKFNVLVGYSDHTREIINPIAATAMGAVVYEKHFTLSRYLPGPDHKASLEPDELKTMINHIRLTIKAIGDGIKRPMDSEIENRKKLRKSVVAQVAIPKGSIITREMLGIKRPGTGLEPENIYKIIGMKATKNIQKDSLITYDDIS